MLIISIMVLSFVYFEWKIAVIILESILLIYITVKARAHIIKLRRILDMCEKTIYFLKDKK